MRKLAALFLLALLLPSLTFAAIARDSDGFGTLCGSGTTCTESFDNVAGNLMIGYCIYVSGTHGTATYNGVSMTYVGDFSAIRQR